MQKDYDTLRKLVETALCDLSVDDGSINYESVEDGPMRNQTLSALQIIRDEHEQDDLKYNPTVDEVLDRILDNAIEAFGTSARDVYSAIHNPGEAEMLIDNALRHLKYDDLQSAVVNMHKGEVLGDLTQRIFSMRVNKVRLARYTVTEKPLSKLTLNLVGFKPGPSNASSSYNTSTPRPRSGI
jgi:hypothetical protein